MKTKEILSTEKVLSYTKNHNIYSQIKAIEDGILVDLSTKFPLNESLKETKYVCTCTLYSEISEVEALHPGLT